MRHCVWSRNLKNEEAMARGGPQGHRKQTNKYLYKILLREDFLTCAVLYVTVAF